MNSDKNSIKKIIENSKNPYSILDDLFISLDKKNIKRTKNLRLIPHEDNRRGGKYAYAEWAHVIGIFQTLMFQHLQLKESNIILDVGCGTGLLGIASEPFIGGQGRYIGLDVMKKDIDFCVQHYPTDQYKFIHIDTNNPAYSPELKNNKQPFPVDDGSVDCVTALSVWTHFNEEDAQYYFKEICRVLKKGAKAIITFFVLDEIYKKSIDLRTASKGRFHNMPQNRWIFDQPCYGSKAWFHPSWVDVPENAIAINIDGIGQLLKNKNLAIVEHYQGNWKEVPGMFFQDIIIFQKL